MRSVLKTAHREKGGKDNQRYGTGEAYKGKSEHPHTKEGNQGVNQDVTVQ